MVIVHDFLFERIGAGDWRFHHFDHFGELLAFSGLEGCYDFLCHGGCELVAWAELFDFLMNRHLFEDRIEFLELKTLSSVFLVLGGDVAAGTGLSGGFVLRTLHYHLNAVPFLGHLNEDLFSRWGGKDTTKSHQKPNVQQILDKIRSSSAGTSRFGFCRFEFHCLFNVLPATGQCLAEYYRLAIGDKYIILDPNSGFPPFGVAR